MSRVEYNIHYNHTWTIPTQLLKFKEARAIFSEVKPQPTTGEIFFGVKPEEEFRLKFKPAKEVLEKIKKRIYRKREETKRNRAKFILQKLSSKTPSFQKLLENLVQTPVTVRVYKSNLWIL